MMTMSRVEFEIATWLASSDRDVAARATLASLRILANPGCVPLTEVEDIIARTVRTHIHVAVAPLAVWLLANWWRLRWEPDARPAAPPLGWKLAHSMAAIGEGYAWPALEIASDGDFIQFRLTREDTPDACAVRYLRDVSIDVPAAEFEAAVDAFIEQVEGRLAEIAPGERTVAELRAELHEERADPALTEQCKLQALAGIDPGEAPEGWLEAAANLAALTGKAASEEVMAAAPRSEGTLKSVCETVEAIRTSTTTVNLAWVSQDSSSCKGELPWERGARLAQGLRAQMGLGEGPLSNDQLGDLLDVKFPLASAGKRAFGGGFANGGGLTHTAVSVPSWRIDNQRFWLARLIGWVRAAPAGGHLLPVTDAATALQKLERSFAQEFLCPFAALDAFTDEHGIDDDGIAEAAEYFGVSQRLVLSTLVNKKKLHRERLSMT
jgi:hypothetical protein